MVLVEIIREVTYEVRQGSVTCHDLIFTNKCKLSEDKLITGYIRNGYIRSGDLNESRTHPVIIEIITRCYASTLS